MLSVTAIMAYIQLAEALYGTQFAKDLLSLFHQHPELTPAQIAQLDANWEDYLRIKAQLESEIGGSKKGG